MNLVNKILSVFGESEEQKMARLVEETRLNEVRHKFIGNCFERFLIYEKVSYTDITQAELDALVSQFSNTHQFWRYVWRRCIAIQGLRRGVIFGDAEDREIATPNECADSPNENDLIQIKSQAEGNYKALAPRTGYELEFRTALRITENQQIKLQKDELLSVNELKNLCSPRKKLGSGFIYLGKCRENKYYIGQTTKDPESRWLKHRQSMTGPYKNNSSHVDWKVIKTCRATELDYFESFYIGYYNSFECGHNDNEGNNSDAYLEGKNQSSLDLNS